MQPVRLTWDPELPVVASTTFTTGGRTYHADQPFPWKELGVPQDAAHAMWRSCLIHHPDDAVPAASPVPAAVELQMPGITKAATAAAVAKREKRARARKG